MKKLTKTISVIVMILITLSSLFVSACSNSTTGTSNGENASHVCENVLKVTKSATCTEDGEESIVCTYCGEVYEVNVIPATGHTFGEWYETKPATCKEEGEQYKDCVNCDFFDTRMIPVTDHDYSYRIDVFDEATCQEEGLAIGYCQCGLSEEITVEIIDHEYVGGYCWMCGNAE